MSKSFPTTRAGSRNKRVILHAGFHPAGQPSLANPAAGDWSWLVEAGHKTISVVIGPDADSEPLRHAHAEKRPHALYRLRDSGLFDWKLVAELVGICRAAAVTIWHAHDPRANLLGLMVQRSVPLRLVTSVYPRGAGAAAAILDSIERVCLPRADIVVCHSHEVFESVREKGVTAERCLVLEEAIDTAAYRRTSPIEGAKAGLGIDAARLVIGVLVPRRSSVMDSLRGTLDLALPGTDFDLMVIASDDTGAEAASCVRWTRRQPREYVAFDSNDVKGCFEALDLLVIPRCEAVSARLMLQALALEVPVVAPRSPGTARIITNRVNGLLFEPDSSEETVRCVQTLLSDEELRRSVRRQGREMVEMFHSSDTRHRRLLAMYESLPDAAPAVSETLQTQPHE